MRAAWLLLVVAAAGCSNPAGDTIGEQIAGTWLGTYEVDAADLPPTAFIRTYHGDGTALTSSARAFGAGDPGRHGLSGTQHVQWEASGPREIRWRLLHFIHDERGTLTGVSRSHGVATFDETFEHSSGTFTVEVLQPDALLGPPNPNADITPIFTATGTTSAARLHVR